MNTFQKKERQKYQIIKNTYENGEVFYTIRKRVKFLWWTFWKYYVCYYGIICTDHEWSYSTNPYGGETVQFATLIEARERIDNMVMNTTGNIIEKITVE